MSRLIRFAEDDEGVIETRLDWRVSPHPTYIPRAPSYPPRRLDARPPPARFKLGFVAGLAVAPMLLLAGHLAPAAWRAPDHIAALTLASDRWQAGERLMLNADPERWRRLAEGSALLALYEAPNAACRRARRSSHRTDRACASFIDPAKLRLRAPVRPGGVATFGALVPQRLGDTIARLNATLER